MLRHFFLLGLLAFPSPTHAGLALFSEEYSTFCPVTMEEQEIPAASITSGWWAGSHGVRGLGDGTFWSLVTGWEPYGYLQAITPEAEEEPDTITGWGWSSLEEEEDQALSLSRISLTCDSGEIGTIPWDGPFPGAPTLQVEAEDGTAETLSADRVRLQEGILEVNCEATSWEDGEPLSITISWFGATS